MQEKNTKRLKFKDFNICPNTWHQQKQSLTDGLQSDPYMNVALCFAGATKTDTVIEPDWGSLRGKCHYDLDLMAPKSILVHEGVFLSLSYICLLRMKSLGWKFFELWHYTRQTDKLNTTVQRVASLMMGPNKHGSFTEEFIHIYIHDHSWLHLPSLCFKVFHFKLNVCTVDWHFTFEPKNQKEFLSDHGHCTYKRGSRGGGGGGGWGPDPPLRFVSSGVLCGKGRGFNGYFYLILSFFLARFPCQYYTNTCTCILHVYILPWSMFSMERSTFLYISLIQITSHSLLLWKSIFIFFLPRITPFYTIIAKNFLGKTPRPPFPYTFTIPNLPCHMCVCVERGLQLYKKREDCSCTRKQCPPTENKLVCK